MIDAPEATVTTTKEELMGLFTQMNVIRRMEIACDNEYKMRNIRGFCHLYDGLPRAAGVFAMGRGGMDRRLVHSLLRLGTKLHDVCLVCRLRTATTFSGQEAVAVGCEAGVTRDDDWITSYRSHSLAPTLPPPPARNHPPNRLGPRYGLNTPRLDPNPWHPPA